MFEEHPVFVSPDDLNVKIWRYFDLVKYLSLLEKRSLYFSRVDLLGDPFEGSLPSTKGQINISQVLKEQTAKSFGISPDQLPPQKSFHENIRQQTFVCSFHMSEIESAALWSIYSKGGQGVAIQSTYKRLVDCFNDYTEESVHIGIMRYIDYNSEIIPVFENSLHPIMHKRKNFEHEKELRAVICFPKQFMHKDPNNPNVGRIVVDKDGLYVKSDLNVLIERIRVAPSTAPWVIELLSSITKKYGLTLPIEQSTLDDNPNL